MNHTVSASQSSPVPPPRWPSRSAISTFIKTLHLLDLDLEPDFPASLTESTFSTTKSSPSLQHRVQATEWCLYRLFSLYSRQETQTRLSAPFPPTSPIESRNLRAGLYKWLTELKKDGVLPRETVLRKTMLDECRGDKFEEVLGAFAMVVLRKKVLGDEDQPKNQKTTTKTKTSRVGHRDEGSRARLRAAMRHSDAATLVPLIIAHRVALQNSLRKRQQLREGAAAFTQSLNRIQTELSTRLQELEAQESDMDENHEEAFTEQEWDLLRQQVTHAFVTDRAWAEYILEGDDPRSSAATVSIETLESLLDGLPFDEILGSGSGSGSASEIKPTRPQAPDSPSPIADDHTVHREVDEPMRQLQALVSERELRIERLQSLRDSLVAEAEAEATTAAAAESSVNAANAPASHVHLQHEQHTTIFPSPLPSTPRFSRHQALHVR